MSVVNGASFYIEVFSRRFEKELIALRKEVEEAKKADKAVAKAVDEENGGNGTSVTTDSGDDYDSRAPSRRQSADVSLSNLAPEHPDDVKKVQ